MVMGTQASQAVCREIWKTKYSTGKRVRAPRQTLAATQGLGSSDTMPAADISFRKCHGLRDYFGFILTS